MWIAATVTGHQGQKYPVFFNTDHVAMIGRADDGRAKIRWADSEREQVTLDESFNKIINLIGGHKP